MQFKLSEMIKSFPLMASMLIIASSFLFICLWFAGLANKLVLGESFIYFNMALGFLLSGLVLFSLTEALRGSEIGEIMAPIVTTLLFIYTVQIISSQFYHTYTGLEVLTNIDPYSPESASEGEKIPIVGAFNFIIVVLLGAYPIFQKLGPKTLSFLGKGIAGTGILALLGHLFRIPALYYEVTGISNEMTISAAFLFVLLGFGISYLSKDWSGVANEA
jgi:hypothetical protein